MALAAASVAAAAWQLPAAAQDAAVPAADTRDPEFSEQGADTCLSCHNSASMRVIFDTPHGQRADPASPMAQLQCEACHGPGGGHSGRRRVTAAHEPIVAFGTGRGASVAEQDAVCEGCHRNDVTLAWTGSRHEREEIGCTSCHKVHTPTDPVTLHASQNSVCFECHRQQQSDSRKPSSHPLRSDAPVRPGAMICTDCHDPHAAAAGSLLKRVTTNELCFDCHADYRGPMIFDHAPVSEDCTLCHQPHGSIHAPLLTRRAPLLCQSCHSQRGHPSVSFTSLSTPNGNPSPILLGRSCMNCHTQVHGSNHPSGYKLMR